MSFSGKRVLGDAAGEQTMKEKKEERDARTQVWLEFYFFFLVLLISLLAKVLWKFCKMLEKTVDRLKEELKVEKSKRMKTQKAIKESFDSVMQVCCMIVCLTETTLPWFLWFHILNICQCTSGKLKMQNYPSSKCLVLACMWVLICFQWRINFMSSLFSIKAYRKSVKREKLKGPNWSTFLFKISFSVVSLLLVIQNRSNIFNELEKHKQGLKILTDDVETLKMGRCSQSEVMTAVFCFKHCASPQFLSLFININMAILEYGPHWDCLWFCFTWMFL